MNWILTIFLITQSPADVELQSFREVTGDRCCQLGAQISEAWKAQLREGDLVFYTCVSRVLGAPPTFCPQVENTEPLWYDGPIVNGTDMYK